MAAPLWITRTPLGFRALIDLCELGNGALSKPTKDERPRARLHWDDLRIFAAVAEAQSITKAALVLKATAGMVSRRLDELESRLETRLLNRTATGVSLTPAGEDIFNDALSMRRFADSIEVSARKRDRRAEGMVTISAPDGLASYWIAPRLAGFLNQHPDIQITLDCGLWPKIAPQEQPDLTIAVDKTTARMGDTWSPLAVLHYVFVVGGSYVENYGMPRSIASAAGDHRTLKHVAQTYQRETWSRRASAVEALSNFSLETNSTAALVESVRSGAGVATLPSYFAHLFPELQIVGQEKSTPIQLWLCSHQESQAAARVQTVASWLNEMFDTRINPWFRDEYWHPSEFATALDAKSAPDKPAGAHSKRSG